MGIQGLLPNLESIYTKINISQYAGKKVAVDAYVWLHRGAISCCMELCQNIPTRKYVTAYKFDTWSNDQS
jgi:exonuclease-1